MSITAGVYAKARSEIIALFGWGTDSLTPDQSLRVDCACALRLALDDLQGRIVRGESADVARMLTASEALARLLPPTVLATPPSEPRADPRQVMWEIYSTMRERGEIDLKAIPDEGLQAKIDEQAAEIDRLKAQLVGGLAPHCPMDQITGCTGLPVMCRRWLSPCLGGARPLSTRTTSCRRARSASAMPAQCPVLMTHQRCRSSRARRCG
jgi:hypothetical protein